MCSKSSVLLLIFACIKVTVESPQNGQGNLVFAGERFKSFDNSICLASSRENLHGQVLGIFYWKLKELCLLLTRSTTAAPTVAPTVAPTAAPICGCYFIATCTGNTNGAGIIDIRIVTPPQCPAGTQYCCPNLPIGSPQTTAAPVTAAPTTAAPTTAAPTTAAPTTAAPGPPTGGGTAGGTPSGTTAAPATTAAPSGTVPACGLRSSIPNSPAPGPGQSTFGDYPWDAVILTSSGNLYIGGGVLVNNRYVLTAAHKVANYTSNLGAIKIRLGDWDAPSTREPLPFREYSIASIALHPQYNSASLANDIAVIRLAMNVPLGTQANIATACLPAQQTSSYVGQRCWVSGWGQDVFMGQLQAIQKQVDVPIVASATCQQQLRATRLGAYFVLDPSLLCAGGEQNKDACVGDGGSPVVCPSTSNQWTVVGLVAWGIGCGQANVPGAYVNIAQLLPWISTQIVA